MPHILVLHPIPEAGLTLLRQAGYEVTVRPETEPMPPAELRAAVTTYDGIISLLVDKITAEVLAGAGPQLKVIANYAVGYDNLDVAAAQAKGIAVTNTPDVLTSAVAEHTMALMVAVARRVVEADAFTRAGKYMGWQPHLFLGLELNGKTLGIVGAGRIGSDVAQRATLGFGMKLMYNDIQENAEFSRTYSAQFVANLDDMLPQVDVLSLHVPLVPATQHLINSERLARFKPTAILINTARGPIVDEAALVTALQAGKLAGAGLDVFEHEPALTPGLKDLPQVVLTPHIASATIETRAAMSQLAAQNAMAVLEGKPPLTPIKL
jgi:glyoxylate reductase